MRAGADAQVRQAAPVGEVVDALPARLRPVRYLVLPQSRFRERRLRAEVHLRRKIRVGLGRPSEAHVRLQRGAGFQRESVSGEVVRAQPDGLLDGALPHGDRLPGQAEHEVDAHVVEPRVAGVARGLRGACGVVASSEHREFGVVERLHPDGDAVEARIAHGGEAFGGAVAGVRLQRRLGVDRQPEGGADRIHQAPEVGRREVGGRAAAEEDAGERRSVEPRAPLLDLASERRHVGGHERLDARVGVEVAVGALGLAEGDVHVEREPAAEGRLHVVPSR